MNERDERIAKAREQIANAKHELHEATTHLGRVRESLGAEEKRLRQRLAAAEVAAAAAARSDSRSTDAAAEELMVAQRLCSAWESEAGVTLGRATQRAGAAAKALREAEEELRDAIRSSEPPS
jgi:hypothetical protein